MMVKTLGGGFGLWWCATVMMEAAFGLSVAALVYHLCYGDNNRWWFCIVVVPTVMTEVAFGLTVAALVSFATAFLFASARRVSKKNQVGFSWRDYIAADFGCGITSSSTGCNLCHTFSQGCAVILTSFSIPLCRVFHFH